MESNDDIPKWFNTLGVKVDVAGDEFRFLNGLVFVADGTMYPPSDRSNRTKYVNRRRQLVAEAEGRRMLFFRTEEWDVCPDMIKGWVTHKAGLSPRLCSARQCDPVAVSVSDARSFYLNHHLQGGASGIHCALKWRGEIVALMTFSRNSQSRTGANLPGQHTLARYAVAGNVPGAAGRLFKFAVATTGAKSVTTFSDNSYASGSLYAVLGFKRVGESEPDYRVWHPEIGTLHKSLWQRKLIATRMLDIGADGGFDADTDQRTESQMEQLLGCSLIWDCGKVRWSWEAQSSTGLGLSNAERGVATRSTTVSA